MQKLWSNTGIKLAGKGIEMLFCPDLRRGSLLILDIYLRVMCFLYPLFISDTKMLLKFTEKDLLFYTLTLLTVLFYFLCILRKSKIRRKRLYRTDLILLFISVLFIIKGSIRIVSRESNVESEIFYLCLIATFFLLKLFTGNFVYYLNLMVFSSFLLYLDILYYYLTKNQGVLGADILLRQPEAVFWLLISFSVSAVLYEKECNSGWKNFYLLVSVLGSAALFLFGDIVAICFAAVFLLTLPFFYQPTVTLIKRNLVLFFSFLGILANLPLLQYLAGITLEESFVCKYGIYIDIFLLCLGGGINKYWEKVPRNRNPETVLMRKFQKWYKQILFVLISFALLLFSSGERVLDFPDKLGTEALQQIYMDIDTSIYMNNSFVQSLFKNYGVIGFLLWICLLIEIFRSMKKHRNDISKDKRICHLLVFFILCGTFFYNFGPVCGPIIVILISFGLSDGNDKQRKSKVFASIGDEANNEKSIIFDKC